MNDISLKKLVNIEHEVSEKVSLIKMNKDKPMRVVKKLVSFFPSLFFHCFVSVIDFFSYTLNLNLSIFGLPKDRYGSVMITSIGSLGFEEAFVPLFPMNRCGLCIAVGKPIHKPVVKNNNVVVKQVLSLCFTFDHRYFDGSHFAKPLRLLKKMFKYPDKYLN